MNNKIFNVLLLLIITIFLFNSCNYCFSGSKDLGNNFYILEGDKKEDRSIVYCSNYNGKCCNGGISIVPTYNNQFFENGNYREYLIDAKSNNNWIIAKTKLVNTNKVYFHIIRKSIFSENFKDNKVKFDSVIESNIYRNLDSEKFNLKIKELKINIEI